MVWARIGYGQDYPIIAPEVCGTISGIAAYPPTAGTTARSRTAGAAPPVAQSLPWQSPQRSGASSQCRPGRRWRCKSHYHPPNGSCYLGSL